MKCYISLIAVFFCLRIWNALTDNYGNVMPVDWKSSHTRALHLLTLNLSEKGVSEELGPSDCAAGADGGTVGAASLSTACGAASWFQAAVQPALAVLGPLPSRCWCDLAVPYVFSFAWLLNSVTNDLHFLLLIQPNCDRVRTLRILLFY